MDTGAVLDELGGRVQDACAATPVTITALNQPVQPYETPADGLLVKTLEALSGKRARTVAFGTEAPFYQALGMEAVFIHGVEVSPSPGSILTGSFPVFAKESYTFVPQCDQVLCRPVEPRREIQHYTRQAPGGIVKRHHGYTAVYRDPNTFRLSHVPYGLYEEPVYPP